MNQFIRFTFKEPVAIAVGPETARVLIGDYVGIPCEGQDIYNLFRMNEACEPIGNCQGQMRSQVTNAVKSRKR